jgi:large subunit ribosomal protein L18
MDRIRIKTVRRARRKIGIRKRITGMPDRPRLTVFKSLKHTYAQIIDDLSGRTLAAACTDEKGLAGPTSNRAAASEVGKRLAQRAKDAGVAEVVFDRNGYRYHGRVKALADGAREGGLKF